MNRFPVPGRVKVRQGRFASIVSLILVLFSSAITGLAAEESPASVNGSWELTWVRFGETNVDRMVLTQRVERVTGRAFGDVNLEGKLTGGTLELKLLNREAKEFGSISATLSNEVLTGRLNFSESQFQASARKPVPRDAQAPRVHQFEPKQFHNHFSGSIAPVLRIYPGDTVRTETVDAGGVDKNNVPRAPGGNPLTGPFYVVGAVRGDTLVIHFNRIRLNRDTAMSGNSIVPSALEPGYASEDKAQTQVEGRWKLDRENGIGTLAQPTEKLKDFRVPLQPMLGCVGVAPRRRQAILSGDLGGYGGNLDYNQIKEGVTLFLPVFEAGALLFVGDGHAAQGDGELTGDALETSMDVEFTVDLLPGQNLNGPRAEDADHLMALGIGNSLTDALQRATTQLSRWLEDDFALSRSEAALMLGFALRYDVAEVCDPHVHVVAKIKKSHLAHLQRKRLTPTQD